MDIFRYINNSDSEVVAGGIVVPAWDQVILAEENEALSNLVPSKLVGLKNGTLINVEPEKGPEVIEPQLELRNQEILKEISPVKAPEPKEEKIPVPDTKLSIQEPKP